MPPTVYVETPPADVQLAGYSPDYNKWFLLNSGSSGGSGGGGGSGGATTNFLMARESVSGTCFWSARRFDFSHSAGTGCCWDYDFDASPYLYPVGFTPVPSGYYYGKSVGTYLGQSVYSVIDNSVSLDICPYPTIPTCEESLPCDTLYEKYTFELASPQTPPDYPGVVCCCIFCEEYFTTTTPVMEYVSGCTWTTPTISWCEGEGEFHDVTTNYIAFLVYRPMIPVEDSYWELSITFQTFGNFSYGSTMLFRCPISEWDCEGANHLTFYSWSLTINPQCLDAFAMMANGITVYPAR